MKPLPVILVDESACVPLPEQPQDFWAQQPWMKVRVGRSVPRFRLNAVINGEYTHIDPATITDRWLALSFLSVLQAADTDCLNRQAVRFARAGAVLLAVLPDEILLDSAQHQKIQNLTVPLMTDPLNRLHRAYGISRCRLSFKVKTFLIDSQRILRHYVVHDLNMWSMDSLRGLMDLKQQDADLENKRQIKEGEGNVVRAS
jgi:alkyl hydroperoxide reductase subunit AhpC